jgi:hypothetical protein
MKSFKRYLLEQTTGDTWQDTRNKNIENQKKNANLGIVNHKNTIKDKLIYQLHLEHQSHNIWKDSHNNIYKWDEKANKFEKIDMTHYKFKEPNNEEKNDRFIKVEDRGDRALYMEISTTKNMSIHPTYVHNNSDMIKA